MRRWASRYGCSVFKAKAKRSVKELENTSSSNFAILVPKDTPSVHNGSSLLGISITFNSGTTINIKQGDADSIIRLIILYERKDGKFYEGKTPKAAFLNSSYDGLFIAGLLELRYIHSLPVERIINYFESHGFNLNKPTAHKLIERASVLFENLFSVSDRQCLKTLTSRLTKPIIGYWYPRRIGYAPYRKMGSDEYPNIIRIGCIQHMKRKLLDCGENDPDSKELYSTMNQLFHEEHKHTIGVDGWTVENNLEYRRQYAYCIRKNIFSIHD